MIQIPIIKAVCQVVPDKKICYVYVPYITQVNRMCRSRRVLATGGKQRIFWLDMVCIETILFHLDSF